MAYVDPTMKLLAHTDRLDGWRHGEKPAPVSVEWDLSNRCSLGCEFCHFGYTHVRGPLAGKREKPSGAMAGGDYADTAVVIRSLREMHAMGVKAVVWSGGGEPTLHPEFDDIVYAASDAGLKQGLYTHGGHINESRGKLLRDVLEWVVVSLDAVNSVEYSEYKNVPPSWFARACTGVTNLIGGRCVVGASFLLSGDSNGTHWSKAYDMLDLARGLGASYTSFRPLVKYNMTAPGEVAEDAGWVDDAMPILESLAKEHDVECLPERFAIYGGWNNQGRSYAVCYGVRFTTVVTPNGKMWVCCNRREFPDSALGDLTVESFAEIWARHPGQWTEFENCRALCRLHMVNKTAWEVYRPRAHVEFI